MLAIQKDPLGGNFQNSEGPLLGGVPVRKDRRSIGVCFGASACCGNSSPSQSSTVAP